MSFAFIFESVGGTEWLVLLGVVLIVVGPKNLPAAARKMGQIMSTLRRAADEFKRQLMTMDQEIRSTVESVAKDITSTGADDKTPSAPAASSPAPGNDDGDPYAGVETPDYDPSRYEEFYPGSEAGPPDETPPAAPPAETAAADAAPPEKKPLTDAELRAVKITVSRTPEARG